jgi:CRP-like cAMP-binding protein
MIRTNEELLDYIGKNLSPNFISQQTYVPYQLLIGQGKRVNKVYIIKSGIAKCFLTDDNGNDFVQEFFGKGEIIGEIEMFNNQVSFCGISAITELTVYVISADNFKYLLDEDKIFNHLILNTLASKIHYMGLRHAHNQLNDVEINILKIKKELPDIFNIIPKKDIAHYLGITLRSLNRATSELRMKKLIE